MATTPAGKRFWFGVSVVLEGGVLRDWLARAWRARRAINKCSDFDRKYRKSWPERNICASVSDFTILLFFHASQLMQARRSANESRSEHYQTLIKMNAKAPWRTV